MISFKLFEEDKQPEQVYVKEPQGMMKKSAAIKQWDKIGVGKSGDGYGVYTVDDIIDNAVIEECTVIELPSGDVRSTVLMDYLFKINNDLYVLALGYGSVYQHRNQPNARWEYDEEKMILKIIATRAIEQGEEIFISYGKDYYQTREQNMKAK